MACVGGCLAGSFNPAQWVIDNQPYTAVPEPSLVFIFPHFCGIALSSFLYFVVYCAVSGHHYRRRPYVTPEVVLPAVCGLPWGIAGDQLVRGQREPGFLHCLSPYHSRARLYRGTLGYICV